MYRIRLFVFLLTVTGLFLIADGLPFARVPQVAAAPQRAPQIVLTLTPVADAWIDQKNPTVNHGADITLVISKDEFLQEQRGLIRFDLSALPAEAVITDATLRLLQRDTFPTTKAWAINVGQITADWAAETVTWAARPTSSCCAATVTTDATTDVTIDWEITTLVNAWFSTPATNPNFGLELSGGDDAGFYTERQYDSVESNMSPQLIISYTVPVATATSTPTATATATSVSPTNTPTVTPTGGASTLRFLDWHNQPIAATLRILCYDVDEALQRDFALTTDAQGRPHNPTLLADCVTISALHLRHTQPAGRGGTRPAFWVYAASGPVESSTLLPVAPVGDVPLARPLILFNLVVSLEWDATAEYRSMVQAGLGRAATYLADTTEGIMVFGPVTIYNGGAHWNEADIQIQVANDLRPAAYVGGIIATPTEYVIPGGKDPTFKPAPVILGRGWDGRSAHRGDWDEESGFRTLIHEWLHYALFLYDEYHDKAGAEIYCTTIALRPAPGTTPAAEDPGAASVMAYQYRASELWHPAHEQVPAAVCEKTDHYEVYQQSDWGTVTNHWYAIQGLADADLPPLRLPPTTPATESRAYRLDDWGPIGDLFGQPVDGGARIYLPLVLHEADSVLPPTEMQVNLLVEEGTVLSKTIAAQVYLYKPATSTGPARLFYEGTAIGDAAPPQKVGEIAVWDIAPTDTFYAFVDRYAAGDEAVGQRFVFVDDGLDPTIATSVDLLTKVQSEDLWQYNLDLVYGLTLVPNSYGRLDTMRVRLQTPQARALENTPPVAQLCVPEATVGCPPDWQQTMTLSGTTWIANFAPLGDAEELPLYGLVRITSSHPNFNGIVRWYRDLSGVGLGHMLAGAPLREGWAMVDQIEPADLMAGACNRVLVMPAADYNALITNSPILASIPLDFDIFYGTGSAGSTRCQGDTSNTVIPRMRLTLFYNEEAVRRSGLNESQLVVNHLNAFNQWQPLVTVVNTDLNTATAEITNDGTYVVGRLGP